MKRILVALDFSESTSDVIKNATEIASVVKAKIYLAHIEPPEPDFVGYDPGPQSVIEHKDKTIRHHTELLEDYKKHVVEAGVAASTRQLKGATVESILNLCVELECEMIVLGSHQHSFFHHLIHGEVTDTILSRSSVPVLVIPPDKQS